MQEQEIGKPKYFNPIIYLQAVEEMINADELERALWMLDNFPGWYRDNPHPRALEMKSKIFENLMSIQDYSEDKHESGEKPAYEIPVEELIDREFCWPRGPIVEYRVNEMNKDGRVPLIVEMGPANYWLPLGLKRKGLKFKYHGLTINKKAEAAAKPRLEDVWTNETNLGTIFCCFETIEHLWNPNDIYHAQKKANFSPEFIFLSTPMYTCFGGTPNWHKRELGHLRTYTPAEFLSWAAKLWPDYQWSIQRAPMMVLAGEKK